MAIYSAPDITSIEADFAVSFMLRDKEAMLSLERGVSSINDTPVSYTPLQASILAIQAPPPYEDDYPQQPSYTPPPTPPPPPTYSGPLDIRGGVTLIGDSVPLGAASTMMRTIPDCYVDAVVSRPVSAGYDILMDLQRRGELREYVVIALGTNGTNNFASLFTQMIDGINPGHRIIVVTPFDGRANENSRVLNNTADWMRGLSDIYDYVTVADWNALITNQVHLLAGDRVHMGGQDSMTLYTECIAEALRVASGRPAK
jgi:hypothetical protein